MRIVLIGPPGAGKGTQSGALSQKYSIPHLSSGDMMRKALNDNTPLGKRVREFVSNGELVPDEIIVAVLNEELSQEIYQGGFILDGYPRNVAQAKNLQDFLQKGGLTLNKVIHLKIDQQLVIDRLAGRRISASGRLYHLKYNPPKHSGKCDIDGSALMQREDDKPDKILTRLKVFSEQTSLLLDYYRGLGLLADVDAGRKPSLVTSDITALLH